MSRIASQPVVIPSGVEVELQGQILKAKGAMGALQSSLNVFVRISIENGMIHVEKNEAVKPRKEQRHLAASIAGTTRALIQNMLTGVHQGYEKKLQLVGVGYRAAAQGQTLNLTLGFSHPVNFSVPVGIKVETPDPTMIVVKGVDKQLVGQAAANIRAYRPPEPYKGKGVRYATEVVRHKETKKK